MIASCYGWKMEQLYGLEKVIERLDERIAEVMAAADTQAAEQAPVEAAGVPAPGKKEKRKRRSLF